MNRKQRRATAKKPVTSKPKVRGLKVAKAPNIGNRDRLNRLDAIRELGVDAGAPAASALAVMGHTTPEKQMMQQCGDQLSGLMATDKWRKLVGAMTGLRQAYVVAYREMQELVEGLGEDARPMLADFIVQYTSFQASKPFSEHEIMRNMVETTLPWLADVIDTHSAADQAAAVKEQAEDTAERLQELIPVGFNHSVCADESHVLVRTRSLVLVGWKNALHWLIDRICDHVAAQKRYLTVRLADAPPKSHEQQKWQIRAAPNQWHGCGNDRKAMATFMGTHVQAMLSQQPDFIVCEDLSKTHFKGLAGRPAGAVAGDGHRYMRTWCDAAACALLGGVPLDANEFVDITGHEYDQLRTFTDLRPIYVSEADDAADHYVVSVGYGDAARVSKEVLDNYARGNIVRPA